MNKHNKITRGVILAFILVSFSISSSAQENRYDKIKAVKIGFITEQLELSTEQAQVFWPIYNAADSNKRRMRRELSQIYLEVRTLRDKSELSEEKSKILWNSIQELKSRETSQNQNYEKQISDEFGFKLLTELLVAERDFNARLVRRMGNQRDRKPSKKKRP